MNSIVFMICAGKVMDFEGQMRVVWVHASFYVEDEKSVPSTFR